MGIVLVRPTHYQGCLHFTQMHRFCNQDGTYDSNARFVLCCRVMSYSLCYCRTSDRASSRQPNKHDTGWGRSPQEEHSEHSKFYCDRFPKEYNFYGFVSRSPNLISQYGLFSLTRPAPHFKEVWIKNTEEENYYRGWMGSKCDLSMPHFNLFHLKSSTACNFHGVNSFLFCLCYL